MMCYIIRKEMLTTLRLLRLAYWHSTEKRKQTQQKQTCVSNKVYYNIKLTQKN